MGFVAEARVFHLVPAARMNRRYLRRKAFAFGEGTAMPALGFLKKFRREFEQYIRTRGKSSSGRLTLPGHFAEAAE